MTLPLLHTDVVPHAHDSALSPSLLAAIAIVAVVAAVAGALYLRRAKK